MSYALTKFSEDTKTTCYVIAVGMFLVIATTATRNLTGKIVSNMFRLLGIFVLTFAVIGLVRNLTGLYLMVPKPIQEQSIVSNLAACSALCIVVISIIVYGSYTLVF